MEGLGEIHDAVGKRLKPLAVSWEARLDSVMATASKAFGGDKVGLAIVCRDARGVISDSHQVFPHLVRYLKHLYAKNGLLKKLSLRYVSGWTSRHDT
jgi:hypothetical protein